MKKLMERTKKTTKKTNWGAMLLKAVLICQMAFVFLALPMEVSAGEEVVFTTEDGGELGNTKLVKGTVALLNDAATVALILEAAIVVVLCIIKFIGMQQADDQEKPKYKKEIKTTIITGIIVFTISGILKAVFSYYA